jgi:hypothetical protein
LQGTIEELWEHAAEAAGDPASLASVEEAIDG